MIVLDSEANAPRPGITQDDNAFIMLCADCCPFPPPRKSDLREPVYEESPPIPQFVKNMIEECRLKGHVLCYTGTGIRDQDWYLVFPNGVVVNCSEAAAELNRSETHGFSSDEFSADEFGEFSDDEYDEASYRRDLEYLQNSPYPTAGFAPSGQDVRVEILVDRNFDETVDVTPVAPAA